MPRDTKPDILDLIDLQCRMATDGSAPTLWFIHAIPLLRRAKAEIRVLRAENQRLRAQPTLFAGETRHAIR